MNLYNVVVVQFLYGPLIYLEHILNICIFLNNTIFFYMENKLVLYLLYNILSLVNFKVCAFKSEASTENKIILRVCVLAPQLSSYKIAQKV